ncbi:CHAP domain-containing protein [Mycolicibacter arupensis]|jgi:hypothetical protein|uniref:CHAP domain-containing protein n=1 Tax=Mycolicibacter arupensis TaxID=342002 RepID=A0A0F5MQS0_9MYCO|nr:CHAP domain-containing protein [Mycolicibacter arupensis]KAA1432731.1 CHAP domain-containing protein [Mycolicibacter arupensis]KKB97105.1 hypothetical protein WR43_20595 [Mycolicibacter arupensis]MCV7275118.1 CHAP domain-containing protein [Mycolicibacter arupensis]OQZ97800.1 CHAP domain-containing protein [Mycolicibacter arupensis]TXI59050.1 MAG: CHAP domain-containing protein [Mycolicibacter arupensis]
MTNLRECAVVAAAVLALGQAPAAYAVPERPVEPPSVQASDVVAEQAVDALPPRALEELDVFRRDAADAALGHPVMYGDGQCYPLVQHYIQALGFWHNTDPSGNAFDLYHHFPTNGLAQYFDQVPFDGGLNEPRVGDIVVYGPGGFVSEHGHAGVVTAVRGSGSLMGYEVAEQNSGGRLFVTLNWRDITPMWNTLGYLRPKV